MRPHFLSLQLKTETVYECDTQQWRWVTCAWSSRSPWPRLPPESLHEGQLHTRTHKLHHMNNQLLTADSPSLVMVNRAPTWQSFRVTWSSRRAWLANTDPCSTQLQTHQHTATNTPAHSYKLTQLPAAAEW